MATRKRKTCKRGRRKGTHSCRRKPGPKRGKRKCKRGRRKGTRSCRRKPGPKRGKRSRRRKNKFYMNYNQYKMRPSAQSRLGSSVPTVRDLERRRREERFAIPSNIEPHLITVKEIMHQMGVQVDQKELNKIGKAVAKFFKKKQGAKSGLKKKEKVEVKPGKIKEFKVTAYHDTPRNRKLIQSVIKSYREGYDDVEEYLEDNMPLNFFRNVGSSTRQPTEQGLPEMTASQVDQEFTQMELDSNFRL